MQPPTPRWAACCGLGLAAGFGLLLVWSAAQAQGFRGRGPLGPPPGLPPPGGNLRAPKIMHVWKCSKCGQELGRSENPFDKPNLERCPHCGARLLNGGIGLNQGKPPGTTTPPSQPADPPMPNAQQRLDTNPAPPASDAFSSGSDASARGFGMGRRAGFILLAAALLGLVVVGVVVFAIVKSSSASTRPSPKRRRPRPAFDD